MARERIIDFLPDLYRGFLPEFFERPLAEERHATCDHCVMCAPAEPDLPLDAYFNPSTKCCTFHPTLPNFSVGGLLRDDTEAGSEGRRRILLKIERRIGVTPFGILPPAKVLLLQRHGARGFGRAGSLVCPYLDQERGACTVWAQREAECATWFCKHNNGQDGRDFWKQLREYLVGVHRVLIAYTLRELGFDVDRIVDGAAPSAELEPHDLDEGPPPADEYASLWQEWRGREEQLYGAAYDLVRTLDRERFAKLVGLHHELSVARLGKRHDAITRPQLPDPLIRNPSLSVHRTRDGGYLLTSSPACEATRLRKGLYELLDYFDGGRPTAEVRAQVRAETGLGMSDSFLVALYQHRILIAARGANTPLPIVVNSGF